eukprot:3940841-Rhodomonas_salina.4
MPQSERELANVPLGAARSRARQHGAEHSAGSRSSSMSDLAGKRAGDGRLLPAGEQRHSKQTLQPPSVCVS